MVIILTIVIVILITIVILVQGLELKVIIEKKVERGLGIRFLGPKG